MLTVVCFLVGYFEVNATLQAIGILYALMTISGLVIIPYLQPETNSLIGFIAALVGLSFVSMLSRVFTGSFSIIGLNVTTATYTTLLLQVPTGTGEESFFRVFLITMLEPKLGTNLARIASAISFGICHYLAYGGQLSMVITATLSGYVLAYVYTWSRSAPAVCGAHVIWDITAALSVIR